MKKKILIIEDDPDVRLGYHIRLAANDYETFFAADGVASIAQANKHRPDLIILDLGLPAGDGFVVLDRLRAMPHLAVIPVIVVSARDPLANRVRALEAGARAFLQKPVDNTKLLELMSECLGTATTPAGTL
jgi:two-component system KDP operon response regulator KdpE